MVRSDPTLIAELHDVAAALADAARPATLAHFRRPGLAADNKAADHYDPVTVADRAAEEVMRRLLATHRPDDAILGEEFGHQPGTSGLTWVLDPIDGTRAYLSGAPTWGTLIAVSDADGPFLGLIDQPYIGERFIGGPGTARMTGPQGPRDLRCRADSRLDTAILFSTYPEVGTTAETAAFNRLARQCRLTRFGFDCYAYALLAAGHVDLVIEAGLQPHDVAAPIAIIQAAGGIVTGWDGGPAQQGGRMVAAANPVLHAQALELLADPGSDD